MQADQNGYLSDPSTQRFMETRLLKPIVHHENYNPSTFPMKNCLVLFGKKGAGKRTLVEQYEGVFDQVDGFTLQDYNLGDFSGWCNEITDILDSEEERGKKRIILVENAHLMAHCRGTLPEQQMLKLMTHVRSRSRIHGDPVFLVLTCSEPPLRMSQSLVDLIDYMCYVPPLSDHQRMILFKRFILNWVNAAKKLDCYSKFIYDMQEEDYRLLRVLSKNTVPGDIWQFCQRCFDAIPYPDKECAMDGELVERMLFATNQGKSIIQAIPEEELQMFSMYIEGSKKRAPPTEEERKPSAAEAIKARGDRSAKKPKMSDKGKEEEIPFSDDEEEDLADDPEPMDEEEEEEIGMTVGSPEWPPVAGAQAWVSRPEKRTQPDEDWENFEAECQQEIKRQKNELK